LDIDAFRNYRTKVFKKIAQPLASGMATVQVLAACF